MSSWPPLREGGCLKTRSAGPCAIAPLRANRARVSTRHAPERVLSTLSSSKPLQRYILRQPFTAAAERVMRPRVAASSVALQRPWSRAVAGSQNRAPLPPVYASTSTQRSSAATTLLGALAGVDDTHPDDRGWVAGKVALPFSELQRDLSASGNADTQRRTTNSGATADDENRALGGGQLGQRRGDVRVVREGAGTAERD